MIRLARHKDFEPCVAMAKRWLPMSSYRRFKLDERETRKIFNSMIVSNDGFASILEDDGKIKGFLLGVLDRMWFTRRGWYGTDLVTLVQPGTPHAFDLIHAFVRWVAAHPKKPVEVRLGLSSGLVPATLANRLYRREGFTETGALFVKSFETAEEIAGRYGDPPETTGTDTVVSLEQYRRRAP